MPVHLLRLANVEHLPTSIQVELLLHSVKVLCVLRGIFQVENLVCFIDATEPEQAVNLHFRIDLPQHNHLCLGGLAARFCILVLSDDYDFVVVANWVNHALAVDKSMRLARVEHARLNLLQWAPIGLVYHDLLLVDENDVDGE